MRLEGAGLRASWGSKALACGRSRILARIGAEPPTARICPNLLATNLEGSAVLGVEGWTASVGRCRFME